MPFQIASQELGLGYPFLVGPATFARASAEAPADFTLTFVERNLPIG